jgi:hypothetical protein
MERTTRSLSRVSMRQHHSLDDAVAEAHEFGRGWYFITSSCGQVRVRVRVTSPIGAESL